jgi:hypothetical protein
MSEKFWTRRMKTQVYQELREAKEHGRLDEAATAVARRLGRWKEDVLTIYSRMDRRMLGEKNV